MTHYRAPVKITFSGTSEWVHADSEAQAATRIALIVGREVAGQLGIRESQLRVEVGKAEEWITYDAPLAPQPLELPIALKAPAAAPRAPGRAKGRAGGRRKGAGRGV